MQCYNIILLLLLRSANARLGDLRPRPRR